MKRKLFSVLAVFAFVAAFSLGANAQYMTQDVIFVKAGYIPVYTATFKEKDGNKPDDAELKGFALQGEYNLNFSGFWLGFGMEYQYTKLDLDNEKIQHISLFYLWYRLKLPLLAVFMLEPECQGST